MHIVEVFGRIFISALFLIEAVRKFFNPDMSMIYMSDHGVPEFLFYPSIAFEIIIPLLLIVGYKTRIAASLLAVFVLTVTLIFHSHHIIDDGMQLTIFLKNLAIIGGLLLIISNKSQICSVDYYLESKKGN
jgi:putative oxidoreductase